MVLLYEDARKRARDILAHFPIGRGNMDGLVALAGTLGAGVVFRPLDSSISGVVVKEDDADPIIYINSNEPEARQRFTLAHEIGHLVERKNLAD